MEEPKLLIERFRIAGFEGYFIEVIKDATNFETSSSKELNYTEIVFDDPTHYCIGVDAPMFEGIYEINGRITKEGVDYIVITKTHFPETEMSYEERINWYYHNCLKRVKDSEKPTLQELLAKYENQDIDYLPVLGTKFVERIPRYQHEDWKYRKKQRGE